MPNSPFLFDEDEVSDVPKPCGSPSWCASNSCADQAGTAALDHTRVIEFEWPHISSRYSSNASRKGMVIGKGGALLKTSHRRAPSTPEGASSSSRSVEPGCRSVTTPWTVRVLTRRGRVAHSLPVSVGEERDEHDLEGADNPSQSVGHPRTSVAQQDNAGDDPAQQVAVRARGEQRADDDRRNATMMIELVSPSST